MCVFGLLEFTFRHASSYRVEAPQADRFPRSVCIVAMGETGPHYVLPFWGGV
jgi:hypothetical protein